MKIRTSRLRPGKSAAALAGVAGLLLLLPISSQAVSGNIDPLAIEIDNPANVYPGGSTVSCSTSPLPSGTDWVKDCLNNTDTPAVDSSGFVTGVITSGIHQTGATAKGHWYGDRLVDGIGGNDQDIFLKGGKEDDTSTWTVGPGTVGSSKYDLTQAYLANNQQFLYLGMERSGNNGTTAFDFEFNQNGPANPSTNFYVPTRTVGDVRYEFDMQGSSDSNPSNVNVHYFTWSGSTWVEQVAPANAEAHANTSTTTPGEPWGHVDGHGAWVTGNFDPVQFGEARVPLASLPGVNNCGGSAFVQIRTRAADTPKPDLKDGTKVFPFNFGSPTANATLAANCNAQFSYDGTGSKNADGTTNNLGYNWSIDVSPGTAKLSGGGVSAETPAGSGHYTSTSQNGTVDVALNGAASATITLKNTISSGACGAATGNKVVTVYARLGATATLTPECNNRFTYSGTASGGNAPYTFAWSFQKNSNENASGSWTQVGTSSTASGEFIAGSRGAYRGVLTLTDTAGTSTDPDVTAKGVCTAQATSNTVNVYDAVNGSVALQPDCDGTFGYTASGSGGKAPYSYAFTLQKLVGATWTNAKSFSATDTLATPGVSGTLDINDASISPNGEGQYRLKVTITDSQGIVCSKDLTSDPVTVLNALVATAAKDSANGSALSVTLAGASVDGSGNPESASLQWQISTDGGSTFVDVAGGTTGTLTYSNFESDATPTLTTFSANGTSYTGKLWTVEFRMHASRTVNGSLCAAFSTAVTVSKITGVDP
jgi:hypothetical protein